MDWILGIDLGTTNSVVSIIRDGKTEVLRDEDGDGILPSVVGFDQEGRLLVGKTARNQIILAPERTVKSIKRKMGTEERVTLNGNSYTPQEISAMILRTLKERAEKVLGVPARKAVITVPAFFNETQRQATREAGELAGLEVVRIINEPTAAALTYEPNAHKKETLLVYDLGGGTFDVSIVQIEQGVVEVLASHGDTHLGGDDFDQLLLDHACKFFQEEHEIDLRDNAVSRSRLLFAVEEAKKRLSFEAVTTIQEEFIAEKDGRPLHFEMEIERLDYESLIEDLLKKTLTSVDAALSAAKLLAKDIDKVILVGGSTRTPRVHHLLAEQLHKHARMEVDPDLCVSLGAAIQGALIAGVDVGPVLVDITPHTLGIQCLGFDGRFESPFVYSPIIERNTALPANRSEIYYTTVEGQETVEIVVLQGEHSDTRHNHEVGKFQLSGLDPEAPAQSEILVRFDLNLDGILTVTAMERRSSLQKTVTIDNAIARFRAKNRDEAKSRLATMFAPDETLIGGVPAAGPMVSDEHEPEFDRANSLLTKARRLAADAPAEDAKELKALIAEVEVARDRRDQAKLKDAMARLEDLAFYLQDA